MYDSSVATIVGFDRCIAFSPSARKSNTESIYKSAMDLVFVYKKSFQRNYLNLQRIVTFSA